MPAVHINFTTVIILSRGPAHGVGFMFRPDRIDSSSLGAEFHQFNKVNPDGIERGPTLRFRVNRLAPFPQIFS